MNEAKKAAATIANIVSDNELGAKKRFLGYAQDAANWNNMPYVNNDNVFDTWAEGAMKQNSGYIFWMRAWNWIETHKCPDTGDLFLTITDAGWEYAAKNGIEFVEGY